MKKIRISRTRAKQIMMESRGRWFTTTHTTEKGAERVMNCRYDGLTSLGNIRVIERGVKGYKGVKLDTLQELKANGETYRISR